MSERFKIRWRWPSGASSGEYQLLDGRKVIGRFDLESQAQRALEEKRAIHP